MMAAALERDTDADWRALGESEPYWGVLTHPDFLSENLTAAGLESFYASGADQMAYVVQRLTAIAGQAPAGPALDFGCGTGRLAEAMTAHVSSVTGYDISPGMLAKARERGKATYVDALPDGPFGWINSFIVFQHIPPARGLDLIADLMARLAPGGMISLQLTIWREAHLVPAPPAPAPRFLRRLLRGLLRRPGPPAAPPGAIMMYDYELSAVTQVLHRAGVEELTLIHTDHGGHHGVIVLGRKAPA